MIKSNYNTVKYFVLSDDCDSILSVIKCDAGEQDVTEKVKQAISESIDLESTDITNVVIMSENGETYLIQTTTVDSFEGEETHAYFFD